ncbi:hypothetical protein [Cellulomonas dongxiuzhuiae]|uniref:DUF4352 domain-containing protein n=1 Tax=Cellulomonas dongxiuzhuiae TaxID=2819979 RepID=A0ABX8GME8_9CELL|nr:hypothetical protein [Cellulomonas dongxiuzhuiae]MBO3095746.1 hypothetical protein [Cellulomonas dongxiuzhuiae]QWC17060.1 hypothetical protein KKR89_05480 [Cellulomonas dongxiuzhuiae]
MSAPDALPASPDDRDPGGPGTSDQQPPPRVRRPRPQALGAGAAVLAALAVGHVVVTAFPVDERVQAPFVRTATVGEPVELRYARLTAGRPTGSTVLDGDDGTLLATPGVWLTVPLTIEALGQPRALGFAELRGGDGRTYTVFTSGRSAFLPGTTQPGVPRYATLRVEVPPQAVPGARLRVGLELKDQRRDDVAEIDLGLTQADAEAWAAESTPVVAHAPSDAPPEDS